MNQYEMLKELYNRAKNNIQGEAQEFLKDHFGEIESYTPEQKNFMFERYGELLKNEGKKLKELERAKVFFETYLY